MDYANGPLPTNDLSPTGGDFHPGITAGINMESGAGVASHPSEQDLPVATLESEQESADRQEGLAFGSPREHSSLLTEGQSVEFRVARGAAPTRRLRLTGNRYTFGSAEGCSIRLNDIKLRPMHAVLIREPSRLIVRAYSVPILVNDIRVTEMTLKVGDRLRLGDYEFELLSLCAIDHTGDLGVSPNRSATETLPNRGPHRSTTQPASSIDAQRSSAMTGSPSAADESVWRQRLRKEIDQWRQRQIECDQREQRIDEREAHLRGRESELWTRAENLYRRETQLQDQESAVYQLHDEYAQRQQELARLREDAHSRDLSMREREADFARQEIEYQTKLKEATEQLMQSRLQAENATEAVTRMRLQFDSLNQQIEELSSQQERIQNQETQQREQHHRLHLELEVQRDQAIDAQAESEARRREAESRVEALEQEVEELRQSRENLSDEELTQFKKNEAIIDELTQRVAELQVTVDEAETESSRLRNDYQDALASVSQLELLVAQSNERGDQDRSDWTRQTEQLREEIEKLSGDLKRTSEELEDLRNANETLTSRLHEVQSQRDDALADAQSRPTHEAFESLRKELEQANQTLEQMRTELARSQVSGEDLSAENEGLLETENLSNHEETVASGVVVDASETAWQNEDETSQDVSLSADSPTNEDVSVSEDSSTDEDAWPTYQINSDDELGHSVDDRDHGVTQPDSWGQDADNATFAMDDVWPATPTLSSWEDAPLDSAENESSAAFSSSEGGAEEGLGGGPSEWGGADSSDPEYESDSEMVTAQWNSNKFPGEENPDGAMSSGLFSEDASEEMTEGNDSESGSLASLLIADLESETDDNSDADVPSTEIESPDDGTQASLWQSQEGTMAWDQEFPHESMPDPEAGSTSVHAWTDEMTESNLHTEFLPESSLTEEPKSSLTEDEAVDENPYASTWAAHEVDADPTLSPERVEHEGASQPNESELGEAESLESLTSAADLSSPESAEAIAAEQDANEPSSPMAAESESTGEEDDSIEAYMNRLLRRVQGSPDESSVQEKSSAELSTSVSLESKVTEPETDETVATTSEPIDPDAPLIPRSQAPENNTSLSAMRELANESARNAISRSSRLRTRNIQMSAFFNFGGVGVAILFGLIVSVLLRDQPVVIMVVWAMIAIISVIMIREGLKNMAEARGRRQRERKARQLSEQGDSQPAINDSADLA